MSSNNNFIKGKCWTTLSDYDCSIVTIFAAVPKSGQRVQVLTGKGVLTFLEVYKVTHTMRGNEPFILVELK